MNADLRIETNREAMRTVHWHRRWRNRLYRSMVLAMLLGLFFVLLSIGLAVTTAPDPDHQEPPWLGRMCISGMFLFIFGIPLTLLFYWQRYGIQYAERLIEKADQLGLLFRWPREEPVIVSASMELPSWPLDNSEDSSTCGVGGLMVTDPSSGLRLALVQPSKFSDLLVNFRKFVAFRYSRSLKVVYAVWLLPKGLAVDPAKIDVVAGQAGNGVRAECNKKVVALRAECNLTDEKTCTALLTALSAFANSIHANAGQAQPE